MEHVNVNQLIEEIIAFEPSLAERREEVRALVIKLLAVKPDVRVDEQFVQQLRSTLIMRAADAAVSSSIQNSSMPFFKKPLFVGGVALACILLLVGTFSIVQRYRGSSVSFEARQTAKLGARAFGSLGLTNGETDDSTQEALMGVRGESFDVGFGTQTGLSSEGFLDRVVSSIAPTVGYGGGGSATTTATSPAADAKMIGMPAPWYRQVRYEYAGDAVTIPEGELSVHHRVSSADTDVGIIGLLRGVSMGLFNVSALSDVRVQSLAFVEDRTNGYQVNVDLANGRVNIYPNYGQWQFDDTCANVKGGCAQRQLTMADLPADTEILRIASDMLVKFGIDRKAYGEPVIDSNWRQWLGSGEAEYVPEVIQVLYPMTVDGRRVVMTNGYPYGLEVGVNIRLMKAQHLSNLMTWTYESSSYDVLRDTDELVRIAELGGMTPVPYYERMEQLAVETVSAQLGTPELVYVLHYRYGKDQPDEFLVPALAFPVTTPDVVGVYGPAVIVPLVKEVLSDYQQGDDVRDIPLPEPVPMPMIESGSNAVSNDTAPPRSIE
ncbi:MAG: hypothetical protein ABIG71_02600 [Candidatus Uhrbacteria bacterium]